MISTKMQDPVCSQCRTRKVKCDRERPRCANCQRDNTRCDYSEQLKRINHTKLLVNNVNELDENIIVIGRQLNRLIEMVETKCEIKGRQNQTVGSNDIRVVSVDEAGIPREIFRNAFDQGPVSAATINKHVVRSPVDLTERLQGSISLFSLSKDFESIVHDSETSYPGSGSGFNDTRDNANLNEHLKLLLTTASHVEPIAPTGQSSSITVPSRQLLRVASTFFFSSQSDFNLEIFDQSDFNSNVERLYNGGASTADYAWILCVNLIILLVLNIDQSSTGLNTSGSSRLASKGLSTPATALSNLDRLLTPKLINIQVLILLTVSFQRYSHFDHSEATFAHACFLARQMGLHQQRFDHCNSSVNFQSKLKVFAYLFIRDKACAMTRGISCWLPYSDCSTAFADADMLLDKVTCAKIELATIQEQIYRHMYSAVRGDQCRTAKAAIASNLKERLVPLFEYSSSDESAELQMDLLATRMALSYQGSPLVGQDQLIADAKLYCSIFIRVIQHEGIIASGDTHLTPAPEHKDSTPPNVSNAHSAANWMLCGEAASAPRVLHLSERFSPLAYFVLAEAVALSGENDGEPHFLILHEVCGLFKTICHAGPLLFTQCSQIAQTFQKVLEILQLSKEQYSRHESQALPTPTPSLTAIGCGLSRAQQAHGDHNANSSILQQSSQASFIDFPYTEISQQAMLGRNSAGLQDLLPSEINTQQRAKRPRYSADNSTSDTLDIPGFWTSDLMAAMMPHLGNV